LIQEIQMAAVNSDQQQQHFTKPAFTMNPHGFLGGDLLPEAVREKWGPTFDDTNAKDAVVLDAHHEEEKGLARYMPRHQQSEKLDLINRTEKKLRANHEPVQKRLAQLITAARQSIKPVPNMTGDPFLEQRRREIRDSLKTIDPAERAPFIEKAVAAGDDNALLTLHACVHDPNPVPSKRVIPARDVERLTDVYQRGKHGYAFDQIDGLNTLAKLDRSNLQTALHKIGRSDLSKDTAQLRDNQFTQHNK
jgi:hypothetical protein